MMTRHVKVSLESFEKMIRGWGPVLRKQAHIVKASNLILNWSPYPYDDVKCQELKKKYIDMNLMSPIPILTVRLMMFGGSMTSFLQHKKLYVHSVIYEDLMNNTSKELENLFKMIDIPTEYVAYAMKALDFDAQRGTFGKRGTKKIFDESDWENCNDILKEIGFQFQKACPLSN